jgi:hypothetical protein
MPAVPLETMVERLTNQRVRRGRAMARGCPDAGLIRVQAEAQARLRACLPERYLDLLRLTDGFTEDGLQVYASAASEVPEGDGSYFLSGIVAQNESLRRDREGYDRLVVFATDSLYVHALDMTSGKYVVIAHDDEWPSRLFDTFEEMIVDAIRRVLRE